jgi:SAM-dependent methyltransferase
MPTVFAVSEQYERHPYPHVPLARWFSKPSVAAAHPMTYELGQFLRTGYYREHTAKTRILVAGCGTQEPLVVAAAHPRAQITAVDLSGRSLRHLRRRAFVSGASRRIETVQADLHDDLVRQLGTFDYVLCTGVIHHTERPEQLVRSLTSLTSPDGVLRVMMYAAHSRFWICELQRYFSEHGLSTTTRSSRELLRSSWGLIRKLPELHPLRTSFETYSDSASEAGLVDGFFHACERPIEIPRFRVMAEGAGLSLLGFGHAWHSQPGGFLAALRTPPAESPPDFRSLLAKRYSALDAWKRLALIDDLFELAVNPVFWLAPNPLPVEVGIPRSTHLNPVLKNNVTAPLMPTQTSAELLARFNPHMCETELERSVEGGCVLGDDGCLPSGLFANRSLVGPKTQAANLECANNITPPAELKHRLMLPEEHPASKFAKTAIGGFTRALKTLDPLNDELLRDQALRAFAHVLEPRIRNLGRDSQVLPWLSAGDLLRSFPGAGYSPN